MVKHEYHVGNKVNHVFSMVNISFYYAVVSHWIQLKISLAYFIDLNYYD